MDLSVSRHARSYDQIRNNPKFRQLAQSRSRLAWSLSAAVLGVYFLFMATVAFAPEWLHRPLGEGSLLTVGMPVGAAVIVFSWLLTGWYVRCANTRFDALNAELLEESQQ
ncbi:Inner membrane protein YjcH [compost metagenome]